MRPLFCRIGSKFLMSEEIIKYIPPHLIYVEPFFGGGAIYFNKPISPAEVINDLDTDLMNSYKLIKKAPLTGYRQDLNTFKKLRLFYDKEPHTIQDKITNDLIYYCNGYSGEVVSNSMYKETNPYNKLKNIKEYKERLANTILLNQNYEKVIKDYDTDETLFYLDPPYEDSKGLYTHHVMDYVKMVDILKKIKGKFLLSINGSTNINKLFKDFKIIEITKKTHARANIGFKPRIELLIMNF